MKPADFNEGDGIHTPCISGYDIVLDRIIEDMDSNPNDYKPWEISFLSEVPQGCYKDYWKDVRAYIEDWCEQRSCDMYL